MVKHTFNGLEDSASTLAGHEIGQVSLSPTGSALALLDEISSGLARMGQVLVSRLTETGPEVVAFVVRPIRRHYHLGCLKSRRFAPKTFPPWSFPP